MAITPDVYVDSTASGTNAGTSWTDAFTSIASAASGATAGQIVGVSKNHNQARNAANENWSGGTAAAPIRVISLDPADNSYVSRNANGDTSGAQLTSTSNYLITGNVEFYGIKFDMTTDIFCNYNSNDKIQRYWDCLLKAGTSQRIVWGYGAAAYQTYFRSCTLRSQLDYLLGGSTDRGAIVECVNCDIQHVNTGYLLKTATNPNSRFTFIGCDLTDIDTLVESALGAGSEVIIRNCQLKSGFTRSTASPARGARILLEGSSSSTNLSTPVLGLQALEDRYGVTTSVTAQYRTNGANDLQQANAHAWSMVSNSNAVTWYDRHYGPWSAIWVTGGSSKTVTFYLAGGATLYDDEFGIELFSPDETGTSNTLDDFRTSQGGSTGTTPLCGIGYGNGQIAHTALTTDSGSTWNGSGVGTKQKIAFTFTPDVSGFIKWRPWLAKASTTVYFDPKPVIS